MTLGCTCVKLFIYLRIPVPCWVCKVIYLHLRNTWLFISFFFSTPTLPPTVRPDGRVLTCRPQVSESVYEEKIGVLTVPRFLSESKGVYSFRTRFPQKGVPRVRGDIYGVVDSSTLLSDSLRRVQSLTQKRRVLVLLIVLKRENSSQIWSLRVDPR